MEDTTNAVAVAPEVEAPAVEASRPTVTAPIYAKPRLEFTKAKYLENKHIRKPPKKRKGRHTKRVKNTV